MLVQKRADLVRLVVGKPAEKHEHAPNVVDGLATFPFVQLDASGAHPALQGDARIAEQHRLRVEVDRPPRGRGELAWPHEQPMVVAVEVSRVGPDRALELLADFLQGRLIAIGPLGRKIRGRQALQKQFGCRRRGLLKEERSQYQRAGRGVLSGRVHGYSTSRGLAR